ncbi:TIGR03826 family flagellar region protein [Aquibacillus albus]|uniref:Flagellar operon protein (TIGR03826 family) n=1 Tax=Aquibacillus albus TaxID=1168171 RepID=A0ABS2MWI1_9BACI|nr:flagellar operon protein (TIGR03826 family) [Aquibacillus albus]
MGELENCPKCGTLFVKANRNICPDCFKEEEAAFRTVYDFMKKRVNRQATILQIVEATGVKEELIIKFVKENRLRTSNFPNLTYACERCGNSINSGRLCGDCSDEIISDLKTQEEIDQLGKRKERRAGNTYFSIDKKNR